MLQPSLDWLIHAIWSLLAKQAYNTNLNKEIHRPVGHDEYEGLNGAAAADRWSDSAMTKLRGENPQTGNARCNSWWRQFCKQLLRKYNKYKKVLDLR